jgi:hypothetical protein
MLQGISLQEILTSLEDLPISQEITDNPIWFPVLEAMHVVSLGLVVGAVLFLDLRLMGVFARKEPMHEAAKVIGLIWLAAGLAFMSGFLMFAPAASRYLANTAFDLKMGLIFLAGLNMLVLHLGVWRRLADWNESAPPFAARLAGAVSLTLWVLIVILGRMVPFTQ